MIHGAKSLDSVVVLTSTEQQARFLRQQLPNAEVVSINDIKKLSETKKTLVLDNSALLEICCAAIDEIERLERLDSTKVQHMSSFGNFVDFGEADYANNSLD